MGMMVDDGVWDDGRGWGITVDCRQIHRPAVCATFTQSVVITLYTHTQGLCSSNDQSSSQTKCTYTHYRSLLGLLTNVNCHEKSRVVYEWYNVMPIMMVCGCCDNTERYT
jgi:hypothetical protein